MQQYIRYIAINIILLSHFRLIVWFAVVWSRQGDQRLGREWSRCLLYIWDWYCHQVFKQTWFGSHLSCSPSKHSINTVSYTIVLLIGGGRWVWIFCSSTAGNFILCTKLLWRLWQCWRNDDDWWRFIMFLSSKY